jgi:hypothetical protein
VSVLEICALIVIVATVVVVLACVVSMATGRNVKRAKPGEYKLGDPWVREPMLFSAVDEPPVAPHGHHDDPQSKLIGGAASGKW